MRFKTDENIPIEIAEFLRANGHDALSVGEQGLSGEPDSTVAAVCKSETRAIVTLDLDFADIRVYPPQEYADVASGTFSSFARSASNFQLSPGSGMPVRNRSARVAVLRSPGS